MKSSPALSPVAVRRVVSGSETEESPDVLAVEEPLEIRVGFSDGKHRAISITMRTPGHDAELAAGFLFTEGILSSPHQIKQIRHCGLKIGKGTSIVDRAAALNSNTIRVDLEDGVDIQLNGLERNFYTTSSCGVCGKSSIEALHSGASKFSERRAPKVDSELIHHLPERLRVSQDVFDQTGGLHASALFTLGGKLEIVREDVGRHNALDKVMGTKFLAGELPLSENILLLSGRVSFELVQKALMAGLAIIVAVGAPSSLAVELAEEFGITLVGFVRDGSFNVYSCPKRVI
ncbi:MAG TPA: formate dehydrogenase accessory sulfurtransferase FdhD [Pyrinomonadaceae bacterium]|nr:formate dehydrogenase accessory sulfurtransferase FdhD [Pyrinomonadaceae bacterium]